MAVRQRPPRSVIPQRQSCHGSPVEIGVSESQSVSMKSGAQQSLPLTDVAALQNIRRANLHVLTSRKGSKVRLSAVVNISASNLDNRLYGQKRMDDAEANRFTERLGLPTAWLDVPRSVSDIPESVSALLDPLVGSICTDQQELPAAKRPEAVVARKSATRKAKAASDRHAQPSEADHPSGAAVTKAVVEQQDPGLPIMPPIWQSGKLLTAMSRRPPLTSSLRGFRHRGHRGAAPFCSRDQPGRSDRY
jgi:hypothetical protein